MLGLPAWGLLLSRWTQENPPPRGRVLKFLGLLVLGLAIFTFNSIWVIFSLTVFRLPAIPLIRLAGPGYRARPLQAVSEVLLAVAAVVVAVTLPPPEESWASPWMHAGGAATAGVLVALWDQGIPRRSGRTQLNYGAVV